MFTIFAQEDQNKWSKGKDSPLPQILARMEANPFVPFAEMQFKVELPWQKYDHNLVIKEIGNSQKGSVGFKNTQPNLLEGSISRHPARTLIQLRADDQYLKGLNTLANAKEYINQFVTSLPAYCYGGATADQDIHDFYVQQDLAFLPDCFGYIGWYHLIHKRGYDAYFTAADMRKIPAHQIEEMPDGAFAITSYPDPYAYESEIVRKKIIEMTNYLNERRKDWK